MGYVVGITHVSEQLVAAARERTTTKHVSQDMRRLLDGPWGLIRESGDLRTDGHNVAIYLEWGGDGAVEVGVQVVKRFEATELVVCSSTPGGKVATATHFGPYQELSHAHRATREWCAQRGHKLAGPAWEIYGDWSDDRAKLRADVYWLLA